MTGMAWSRNASSVTVSSRSVARTSRWAILLAACAGQFLVVLDVSVVNVALPSIRTDLGMSAPALQWVLNAYTITFAGLMLLGGRAADFFGRKTTFIFGLGLFTLASLAGGLAQEGWQLIAARAAQGVGAAILSPSTLTILTSAFPDGPARARAIGTWTAVGAGGGAAGGFVGGILTDTLSWRWVLLINVPVGVCVLAAAAIWLTEQRQQGGDTRRRLDLPGALLVTGGLGSLAYGVVQTESVGWAAPSALLAIGAGLTLLVVFVLVESRVRAPLVPLKVFRNLAVSAANAAMFINGAAMFSMWFFISLYMQNVLGFSPIQAGLGFLPQSLSIILGSKLAPWLMARVGARNLAMAGSALAATGCLWQTQMHAEGTYLTTVLGPGVLMALGVGLAATPLATVATAGAAPGDAGLVSGLVNTSRTMGGALGLAVLSTAAASRTAGSSEPAELAAGFSRAFQVSAGILVLGLLLMLAFLPDRCGTRGLRSLRGLGFRGRRARSGPPHALRPQDAKKAPEGAPQDTRDG